ncbi:radical SAM protein [Ramlibacter ginsenosidimutans]|uniref:Radical SAM protein n=1 Tax=Ramlibacter ginsenosidimutans TaxID=502333 RepID=A0A934WKZ5_9BURK|nr:radical SAM protein [Ramlibacter ginsenosidimutans]MBK6004878.1 radical SAM protein [Ramlibacter ginsenosidimutans]
MAWAPDPAYVLHCVAPDGSPVRLHYRPHRSELLDDEGAPLFADVEPQAYDEVERVSPQSPGWKSREAGTLKIQLGMRCNYACSYCNQASSVGDAAVTRTADAAAFLATLDTWLQGAPGRIEFWGGEPLLYFAKLKVLVPQLRARFPDAHFSMISNGSLLDEEILEFIERWDLHVAISHDGPGQSLRGPDPLDAPRSGHWIRALVRRRGGARRRVMVNVVLTAANADIAQTAQWLRDRFGHPDLALETEGAVGAYDETALAGPARWTPSDYARLHESIAEGFVSGEALRYASIRQKARDFIGSLRSARPASALGQKCSMDDPGHLAVDLQGNVMTCQTTGARGQHKLGHVGQMEDVRLDTATHWSGRECCWHCPVVQLCQGGCMFLQDASFAQSCENEYRYNQAILAGILRQVTGLRLQRITGDIRRPRAVIPIVSS